MTVAGPLLLALSSAFIAGPLLCLAITGGRIHTGYFLTCMAIAALLAFSGLTVIALGATS
jgi:hypothetical protein